MCQWINRQLLQAISGIQFQRFLNEQTDKYFSLLSALTKKPCPESTKKQTLTLRKGEKFWTPYQQSLSPVIFCFEYLWDVAWSINILLKNSLILFSSTSTWSILLYVPLSFPALDNPLGTKRKIHQVEGEKSCIIHQREGLFDIKITWCISKCVDRLSSLLQRPSAREYIFYLF